VISSKGKTNEEVSNANHPFVFNNLGIPGAILYDAVDDSPIDVRADQRGNPFYEKIMRNTEWFGKSIVEQALRLSPTVLTFWMGLNDVLVYGMSGGTRGTNSGLDGNPPGTHPTDIALFQLGVQNAFAAIKERLPNSKVIVANIPPLSSMPYFTTLPRKLPNESNPALPHSIYYRTNSGSVIAVGPEDFLLLPAREELSKGNGLMPSTALPSEYVLDESEHSTAIQAIAAYNNILYTEALRNNFTYLDMHAFFDEISKSGLQIAGESYNSTFISGGMFSLDGVNLSSRGSAIVANHFLATMNEAFGANIHFVQLHTIPGIPAPGRYSKRR
jgi:hypothetical protein